MSSGIQDSSIPKLFTLALCIGLTALFMAGCEDGEVVSGPDNLTDQDTYIRFNANLNYVRDIDGLDSTLVTFSFFDYDRGLDTPIEWIEFGAPRLFLGDEIITLTRTYPTLFSSEDTLHYQLEFLSGTIYQDAIAGIDLPVIPEFDSDTIHVGNRLEFTIEDLMGAATLYVSAHSTSGSVFSVSVDQPGLVSIPLPYIADRECDLRIYGNFEPRFNRYEEMFPDTTISSTVETRFTRNILLIQDLY